MSDNRATFDEMYAEILQLDGLTPSNELRRCAALLDHAQTASPAQSYQALSYVLATLRQIARDLEQLQTLATPDLSTPS